MQRDPRHDDPRNHHPARAVSRREAWRPEGDVGAARRFEAASPVRQHPRQGVGPRVSLEADARLGRVRHYGRAVPARGDSGVLPDPRPGVDSAGAGYSGGDSRWAAGDKNDA